MSDVFPSITFMIPGLKLGDQESWNRLCDSFRDGLIAKTKKFLKSAKLEKRCNADDLVQETFLKAWKQHETFRGRTTSQFAKWLLVILRNTYLDLTRRKDPEQSTPTSFEHCDSSPTPSAEFASLEDEAILHACLSQLDPKSREILLLRHFEELKFAEVAERTGMNANTVASICRRGLIRLSELMEFYEGQKSNGISS